MDLRFAGACTDRGPAEQIVEVPGSQRLQQFAGDGQTGFENIQHQPPRQMQPLGHVTAAVQMRIVDQPFPANGSARLFHIGAHHQQQLVADFVH